MTERGKALEVIQKSGVLNPKLTLGEILEISSRLEAIDVDPLAAWTFISPQYVYKGDKEALTDEIVRR